MNGTIQEVLSSFDRAKYAERLRMAEAQRQQFLDNFPLKRWPEMSLEEYALGHEDSDKSFGRLIEFQSRALGSISGGSSDKHAIYHHRKNGWTYNKKLYKNEKDAWEAIRAGFLQAFKLAESGNIEAVDDVAGLAWAPMVRLKTLSVYFPKQVIPVFSKAHLQHFLGKLGCAEAEESGYRVAHLNQVLLKTLRSMPEAKDLSNLELSIALYEWSDPRLEAETGKPSFEITAEQMEMLWQRFNARIDGFTDFSDPCEDFIKHELQYKRRILERYKAELGNEHLAEQLTGDLASEAYELLKKISGSNLVQFQSWRQSIGETPDQFRPVLMAYLDVARKPYEKASDLRPIIDATKAAGLKPAWDTMSTLLWVMRPSDYFPVKIQHFRQLAEELGSPLPKGRPGVNNFAKVRNFVSAFRDALDPKQPQDWIDVQSFIWCVCPKSYNEDNGSNGGGGGIEPIDIEEVDFPLNQILYGPPGTGKTWQTFRMAVEIVDGESPESDEETKARFDQLLDQSRIAFVTFHQSFSYEDFVEGIRPVIDGEGSEETPRYECRDGIFKLLSLAARSSGAGTIASTEIDLDNITLWKMSLGDSTNPSQQTVYEHCIEASVVAHGFGRHEDFSDCATRASIEEKLLALEWGNDKPDYHITALDMLKNQMQQGDLVIVSDGNHKFRAIGRINGDYKFVEGDFFQQTRPVEWLRVFDDSQPKERLLKKKVFSQATIYKLRHVDLKLDVLREMLTPTTSSSPGNFVLIIDEINRGNISKILGELITLLEPDKRAGADNELSVKLPYSQDSFSVPGNLYLLGTMNTADKSIALVDAALRRRFRFIELMPDMSVCTSLSDDMREVLAELNRRIIMRKDRDHQIGHSYFIGVTDDLAFNKTFEDRVLSLLQEYFYNDWDGLRFVLGEEGTSAGRFVKAIDGSDNKWSRNKWTWYRDTGGPFDFLSALLNNYKLVTNDNTDG